MIRVVNRPITVAQVEVDQPTALSLGYILNQYIRSAADGDYGRGTSVDDDIKLARETRDALWASLPLDRRPDNLLERA